MLFYAILGIVVVVALFLIFRDDHDKSYNRNEKKTQRQSDNAPKRAIYSQKEVAKPAGSSLKDKLIGYIPRTQLDWYEEFNEEKVTCPFVGEIELDRTNATLVAEIKVIIPSRKEFVREEIEYELL